MDLKRTLKITAPIAIVTGLSFYGLSLWHSKSSFNSESSTASSSKTIPVDASRQTVSNTSEQTQSIDLDKSEVENAKLKQLDEYQQRMAFREQVQEFAQTIEERTQSENVSLYESLLPQILQFEKSLHMSRAESFYLQASLLNKIYEGDIYLEEHLTKLSDKYPQQEPSKNHLDDKFYQYKSEEQRILKKVMAMEIYPDGLTREAYLRKLLLEARQKIYQQH